MFGGHLEATADVAGDKLAGIFAGTLVHLGVLALVEQQVVAHTATDKRLLDARQGVYGMINVEQRAMVGVQVGADARVDARGTFALLAQFEVRALHAVHVGTWAAQVAQITFEVGQFHDGFYFAQNAFLASAHDEFPLMGGDGTECTTAETAAMDVDGVLDHVVGRDALAFVFGMGQACVGQVERMVQLLGGEGRIGWIDDNRLPPYRLQDARSGIFVALFLDVAEVGGLLLLVSQTFFMGVKGDVTFRRGELTGEIGCLRHIVQWQPLLHATYQFDYRFFAHSIDEQVGPAVAQNAGTNAVLPVVVVGEAAHTGLDTAQKDGNVGVEPFQDLGIDNGRIFRTHVGACVGRIGIIAAQAFVGRIFVDHRVHAAGRYAEEQTRTAQFLEVAQVVTPVGLGYNGHPQSFGFEDASDDGGSERGMVHVGITAEDNHVQFFPPAKFHFFLGCGQPVCQSVFFHGHKDSANQAMCKVCT